MAASLSQQWHMLRIFHPRNASFRSPCVCCSFQFANYIVHCHLAISVPGVCFVLSIIYICKRALRKFAESTFAMTVQAGALWANNEEAYLYASVYAHHRPLTNADSRRSYQAIFSPRMRKSTITPHCLVEVLFLTSLALLHVLTHGNVRNIQATNGRILTVCIIALQCEYHVMPSQCYVNGRVYARYP